MENRHTGVDFASMGEELVLVTGGSGFLGAHCIVALLERGYRVRTTVRSMDRQVEVWAALDMAGLGRRRRWRSSRRT